MPTFDKYAGSSDLEDINYPQVIVYVYQDGGLWLENEGLGQFSGFSLAFKWDSLKEPKVGIATQKHLASKWAEFSSVEILNKEEHQQRYYDRENNIIYLLVKSNVSSHLDWEEMHTKERYSWLSLPEFREKFDEQDILGDEQYDALDELLGRYVYDLQLPFERPRVRDNE